MKILLVEDRITRQNIYLGFDINIYKDTIKNLVENDFDLFKNQLQTSQLDVYNDYEVICLHKSPFNLDEITKIREWAVKNSIKLVFFSGGITTSKLTKNELHINSRDFYSNNLSLFLESVKNNNLELLILQFGKEWELSVLLSLREKINNTINQILDGGVKRWSSIKNYDILRQYIKEIVIDEAKPLSIVQLQEITNSLNNLLAAKIQ